MITFLQLGRYGRLGNQLFQIASTIGIARKNNADYSFPSWYCNYTKKHMSPYFKYSLPQNVDPALVQQTYEEPYFNYRETMVPDYTNLHGYYQSDKYFEHCLPEVNHYFIPADNVVESLKKKYGKYISKETCSIHVRRGDYVGNSFHSVCDISYYKRAVDYIQSNTKVEMFFVFSDDIEWCRTQFPHNYLFINGNNDVEDLFLMGMCKHNIIANSSFSWWGAWFNKNPGKMVVAPNRWFTASNVDYRDVYTKDMIKL